MEQELKHYEFINSQTGNVIAYVSFTLDTNGEEVVSRLERKKIELAISKQLYVDLIYWQEHDHCIR